MLPFSTILLRRYYEAIGWNEDNLYSNITRGSASLLDFPIPDSLILQLANAPTPIFFTSYALDALPQLNGSMSYFTASEPLHGIGPSHSMPFRDVVERFRVYAPPTRPVGKPELWLGGRRIEGRDYLLYSRLHLPTMHLSGLAAARLAPTLQAQIAFVNQPRTRLAPQRQQSDSPTSGSPAQPPGNLLISLQHDTGRYSGEYTYSASDGMFGLRGLYNFGWQPEPNGDEGRKKAGSEEEEMTDGGLRGRFSAGGEVFFSIKQKSLGLSTGVRFTTLPASTNPNAPPPSPPTTITVLYNPLIGFLSTAYAAQVSPTLSLATRFGVNVYSYESDFAFGGEWWIGRRIGRVGPVVEMTPADQLIAEKRKRLGGVLREPEPEMELENEERKDSVRSLARDMLRPDAEGERDGVLKARISDNWSLALLYESRIRKCLVSVGLISDILSGNSGSSGKAIRSVGLEVQYYS